MTTEPRRTLVVSHDFLTDWRESMHKLAETDPENRKFRATVQTIDAIIDYGTVVDLPAHQVIAGATRLADLDQVARATPVRTTPRQEREQFYSEAHAVDADWMPAGGAA